MLESFGKPNHDQPRMYQRPLSIAILALCGSAVAPQALALGFGRIPESLAYGQALDLAVPLRLEPGESLSPACMSAEISVGERRLPTAALRLQLEGMGQGAQAARVRIRSNVIVREPVATVNLSVGCVGAVSRRFTVFADPSAAGGEAAAPRVAALPRAAAGATARPGLQGTPTRTAVPTSAGAKGDAKPLGAIRAVPAQELAANGLSAGQPPARGGAPVALRLKLGEPVAPLQAATLAVATQGPAALADPAASSAEQRMAVLERTLHDMRGDATAHREAMDQLRSRLGQAEARSQLVWVLLAVAIGLAAVALLLGLRLRKLRRAGSAVGRLGAAAAPDVETLPSHAAFSGLPLVDPSVLPGAGAPVAKPMDAHRPARTAPVTAHREDLLPSGAIAEETLTRALSVDELVDLEQQAEFFLVLGEQGAAIDLLIAHLRSSGGVSPLLYLKLLEIYRRRQDRDSFERMRKRFHRRFDAVAPDWGADPEHGRALQDYPAALAALQQVWHSPLDAMAELESLLFHRRGGELFELPAYREVLTLFGVARDLHRQVDGRPAADVDVLLPLQPGHDGSAPVPSIFDRLEQSSRVAGVAAEDRHKAPIDLDLSDRPGAPRKRSGALVPVVVPLRRGRL